MTEAQAARLSEYLFALQPCGRVLRKRGWPVEIEVAIVDHRPIVTLRLDVDDTRIPVEAASEATS